ncbi:protein disulfide oxidoreductase [Klebsiella quasipneumoniae]|uniref:protein disulfide oxidoreductase n=1 Tax=Klebsiella quasipneumoniae TaxID=1463165 RepID=UPI00249A0C57|nr:protein disulfide oxidoreductase [Klebsiella quasipneumoniae]MDI3069836.1 protein disulfide oxidoreductase [Klebsiella quasipneumoniae]HBR1598652.1 protein disulfide oxidoreductase [Klebsiella quasipneumoniae subsp. quasipneumoniae]HCD2262701.1 protein disulfide oxidoreductase [Klebsiella quasipneumoniae]HCI6146610.1 protein disulfide oxidoreductase [Klebsiella quasipneumoniae subsp. quasipneumoniae]
MASKLRRWLCELAVWLLIGAAVGLAVDYFRQPALPQNVSATSLHTLDGRAVDLNAMSQQKPLLLYVWATWCGVCRYTTPSVASLAADGGNVLTVALRSGDNAALETWLARKKLALPTVNDPSGQLARQWDIRVTPTLVVIYRGEVKSVTSGWGMRLRLWLATW